MKIRHGFVSNSSSSSFIIGIKDNKDFDEGLTKDALIKVFGVERTSLLYNLSVGISEYISEHADEQTIQSLLNDYGYDTVEELMENIEAANLINDGYKVYTLSASYNETDDPIELLIGQGGLNDINANGVIIRNIY